MTLLPSLVRHLLPLLLGALLAACGGGGNEAPQANALASASPGKARALSAEPVTPFTGNGWYWNPQEGGTGFMVEAQGSRAFVGFFMYEEGTGNPIWYVATGDLTNGVAAGDHRFSADLLVYHGGMGLTARTWTRPTARSLGEVVIDFVSGRASVSFPGGRVMQAERFCAGGPCVTDPAATPRIRAETGWYWNPAEGGRGYAIESYGARSYMGIFHYNPDGRPVWHIVPNPTANGSQRERLELYTGGQSLTSAYRNPTLDVVAGVGLNFRHPCAGQFQVPGSPATTLRRFVIDDTRPPGAECKALATLVDVPDVSGPLDFGPGPGDLVHGMIDTPDDADGYQVYLDGYDKTHTFDLMGASSGSGTLANPRLSLHDTKLALIAENDDRDATSTDARLSITIPSPGLYFLRVRSSGTNPGTGSFVLKVSGMNPGFREAPLLPVADHQGIFTGRLRGAAPAHVSLSMNADGTVAGVMSFLSGARPRVAVSGTVAPDGLLTFSGAGVPTGPIRCQAAALHGGIFGGCGDAGMLAGQTITRTVDRYGPITLPASATVGQVVPMSADFSGPYPITYRWEFGDGSFGEGAVPPPHVYAKPGQYTVTASITGGSSPTATSFARASLMVFCADGSLCTDLDEPVPSVTIDSAACTLQPVPPGNPTPYVQGPSISFAGRASGSSSERLRAFVSGNRRVSEAQLVQSTTLFGYWDQVDMRLACDGRDPCSSGPFGNFSDSAWYRVNGAHLPLTTLWEQRPLVDPQAAWLYIVLFDKTYSRVLAYAEQGLTCPGHVGVR